MTSPYRIVIVGGGTAGWMCAAALAAKLDLRRYQLRLVESDEIGTVGVGEATLPQMKDFNDFLGLDEAAFMAATGATFKLGIQFVDWGRKGRRYFHPFGTFGRPIGEADFFHYWLRGREQGFAADLDEYCIANVAARGNRFMLPTGKAEDVRNAFAYAYHLDAFLYARFLREWAKARGVVRIVGRIVDVAQAPGSGDIQAVTLASGERIEGDLFVDCSGFRSLLLGDKLAVPFDDWSKWLPCDRAVAVPSARTADLAPYTRVTRRPAGWQWRIPLQHRAGNGYVYSSRHVSDDEAAAALLASLDGEAMASPRVLRFTAGKRERGWDRNVVGMGLAGGFLEPLESTSIYLIQVAIVHLLTLLPKAPGFDPALRDEFNRIMDVEYGRIRDFLILHYIANPADAALWEQVTKVELPESLQQKIARFRHRGHILGYRDGLFGPPSWQAVFIGQDVHAQRHDRLADAMPDAALRERLGSVATAIAEGAAAMPAHEDFVARYCPAGSL